MSTEVAVSGEKWLPLPSTAQPSFPLPLPGPETKGCCISISSLLSPLTPQPTNHKARERVTKELLDFDQAEVKRLNFSPGTQSYPFLSKWSLNVMEVGRDLICIQVPKE